MKEETQTMKHTKAASGLSTRDIVFTGFFSALIVICSWISIPMTIPFTLQTFAVFLSVILLGGKRGTLSVIVYILLGTVGLPVFSGFKGGIGVISGPTGGYILGFIFASLIMWAFEAFFGNRIQVYIISMILGLSACYAFGTLWFMIVYNHQNSSPASLSMILGWCVLPFIIPDLIKITLALILGRNRQLRKLTAPF